MGLSRIDLWTRLGRVRLVVPMLAEAEREWEHARWSQSDVGHGRVWHDAMHISSFPGDDPTACVRKLVYGLLDAPAKEPMNPRVTATGEVGKAVELMIVDRMDFAGRLLSVKSDQKEQTRIEDADLMLTGSPDIVVLPRNWRRPLLIESKVKADEVVAEMIAGTKQYDPTHRLQALGYLGYLREVYDQLWPEVWVCRHTWRLAVGTPDLPFCRDHGIGQDCLKRIELQPPDTVSLLYSSRSWPTVRIEYIFGYDPKFVQQGRAKVKEALDHFRRRELPPHPGGGKGWSELPCRWCDYKRDICKPDWKAGNVKFEDSVVAARGREVYGEYDLQQRLDAVESRWEGRTGITAIQKTTPTPIPPQRPKEIAA